MMNGRMHKITEQLARVAANPLWCIIAVNVVMFCGVHIAALCGISEADIADALLVHAGIVPFVHHIYNVLTYMFVQVNIFHLVYNMMWLWCFGMLVARLGGSLRQVGTAYFWGGIAGAVAFVLVGLMWPESDMLMGASAAVMAVVTMAAVRIGQRKVEIYILGNIKILWLAIGVLTLTFVGEGNVAAHAGGAIAGVAYALWLRRAPKRRVYRPRRAVPLTAADEAELDDLLAQVSRSGFNSLSPARRTRLFELSQRKS